MVLRYYPAFLIREGENPYGLIFPDLPGCVSAGDTIQEVSASAAEALSLHIDGMLEAGETVPDPSPPDVLLPEWAMDVLPAVYCEVRVLVPVEMPGKSVRTNITLDEALLSRLDAAAAAEGMSRSGFIAQAIRERLRERAKEPA
jgi:predicted RNase H-like HicB family nuclease